jgi:hypothetical protein
MLLKENAMKDPWAGTVLIVDDEFDYDPLGSYALREIISELKTLGVPIITSPKRLGGVDAFLQHPKIGCVLLDYHLRRAQRSTKRRADLPGHSPSQPVCPNLPDYG